MRDARHKRDDHLGLGLYIVKLVAESHRGYVQARDMEDREGAVLSVVLPVT